MSNSTLARRLSWANLQNFFVLILTILALLANSACAGLISQSANKPPVDTLTVSNVVAGGFTATSATIVWTTNIAADSQVNYGTTAAYGQSSPDNSTQATMHSVTVSGLSASTLYHFQVSSKISGGSPVTSSDQTFTTTAAAANPPSVSITAPAANATVSGILSITATAAASGSATITSVQFQVDSANVGSPVTSSPYNYPWDTTTVSNGIHTLNAVATDSNDNSATSASVSVTVSNASSSSMGPLKVLSSNPRYFTADGVHAVYLTGSHTWADLKDDGTSDPPAAFDYSLFLTFLKSHNHDFIRLWTRELPTFYWDNQERFEVPWAFLRTGPGTASDGKPQFDLTQLDQTYFDRLRTRVQDAQAQGIYVSIMLFDGFGLQYDRYPSGCTQSCQDGYPYDAGNNVNGISGEGTTSQTGSISAVTAFQEAYVQKVIDTVNDLPNVLYEICDEAGSYSTQWQTSLIQFVKTYEATKPYQHPVGMTFQYPSGTNSTLFSSAAAYISPGPSGGYSDSPMNPPANSGSKVIISDTDHDYGYTQMEADGPNAWVQWVWQNFTRGLQSIFMDPYLVVYPGRNNPSGTTPDPTWDPIRNAMGATLTFASNMNLAAMTPQDGLSSTSFCLANPGTEYLVFQPGSGSFNVNLTSGTYNYEWYDPVGNTVVQTGSVSASGGNQSFNPPISSMAVLYLKLQ
ncbi:MAG: Ig-like domain-containing protein [Candidatus Acidiferrales bacterium]